MSEITQLGHFINGQAVAGSSGNTGVVNTPTTGQQTGSMVFASVEEVDIADALGEVARGLDNIECAWNLGDTHMYGPEGIRFYTKAQAITSRWPDPAGSSVDLGFPRND